MEYACVCVCAEVLELTQPSTYDFPPHESYKLDFFLGVFKFIRIQWNETYLFVIGKVSKRCWDIKHRRYVANLGLQTSFQVNLVYYFCGFKYEKWSLSCTAVGDL